MLQEMFVRKEEEIKAGNFAEASFIQEEQNQVVKKIERLRKRIQKAQDKQELFVCEEDIAAVVSSWT